MEKINDQIIQLKENILIKEKYARRLEQLKEERKQEAEKERILKEQLEKELKDVDKLEGISLSGFFLMLSGKKEERIEKEKEEAYKAKILHEESKQRLTEIEDDMVQLTDKLVHLGDVDSELAELLKKKERLIHMTNPALSELLTNLEEQQITWGMELTELEEAIAAAGKAKRALHEAESALSSARDWGYVDMFGGGLLSTYAKRSHMDEAREAIHSAQYYLKRLQSELDDLGKKITANLEVGDLLHIADYFFDNIFSDWLVQDKISASAEQVDDCLRRVTKLEEELKKEKNRALTELKRVEEERLTYLK